jgi:hypothetical protein
LDLHLNYNIADSYKSNSQKIRVITENWVKCNLFCPYCGNSYISHFKNNMPVADFYCPHCNEEYELKSKNGLINNKIADGAYGTMINRITSTNNPNFFFMQYYKTNFISNYKLDARGWILDILNCINQIPDKNFTLNQIYEFTEKLSINK